MSWTSAWTLPLPGETPQFTPPFVETSKLTSSPQIVFAFAGSTRIWLK